MIQDETVVSVTTGARMHFGLILGSASVGWKFGGIGVMVRRPGWRLDVGSVDAASDVVHAVPAIVSRVKSCLESLRASYRLPVQQVRVHSELPMHSGFGSGTQLALAIAAASVLQIERRLPRDMAALARLVQRSERSAIGTAGFQTGGFLVDRGVPDDEAESKPYDGLPVRRPRSNEPGKSESATLSSRVSSIAVPEAWRFVLIRPTHGEGLCGAAEQSYFARPNEMPGEFVDQLGELIDGSLTPAVRNADFELFTSTLGEYGHRIGTWYAREQGDVIAHPAMRLIAQNLAAAGVQGVAQSSWGPGIVVPARNDQHATSILKRVSNMKTSESITSLIAEPLNCGAMIRTEAPERSSRSVQA